MLLNALKRVAPSVSLLARNGRMQQFASEAAPVKEAPMKIVAVLYNAGEAAKEKRLLGCTENALGLREWLESRGHTYVVTSDKEGDNSELDKHLPDADIVITTPFHPAYLTPERIAKAKKLKLALTAGIGSDHVSLPAAVDAGITVAECTGCNVVSVAEHVVMMMLALVRNYIPAYTQVIKGEWNVAAIAERAWDLEGKIIGTVGAGRIGQRVLSRVKGFEPKELLYTDFAQLPPAKEAELGARYVSLEELVKQCDVIAINCPLHKDSEHLFNAELLAKAKPGVFIVNTARGKIVDADALVDAVNSGHVAGYAGDVWYPQPAPADHPWRTMPRHAMTPHYSGTTLDAQVRYAAGTKDILEAFFEGRELRPSDVIVLGGKLAAQYDASAKDHSLEHEKGWEAGGLVA